MTTSLDDLKRVGQEALESSEGGGGFKTIAKAKADFGFQVWVDNNPLHITYKFDDKQDESRAHGEASEAGKGQGRDGQDSWPQKGILLTIDKDDVPTHPDGKFNRDWLQFVQTFHSKQNQVNRLDEEAMKRKGTTLFPYDALLNSLIESNAAHLFDGFVWVKLDQKIDGYTKAIDRKRPPNDEGKEYHYNIFVVEKVYTNENEAKTEANQLKQGQSSSAINGLSELAATNGWTKDSLMEMADTINEQLGNATKGEGVDGSKLTGMNPVKAKQYIADNYSVTVEDLELLIPF